MSWHISYIIKHIILAGNAFLPPQTWWQLELSSACCRRWSILNSSRQLGALCHSGDLLLTTSIMSFGIATLSMNEQGCSLGVTLMSVHPNPGFEPATVPGNIYVVQLLWSRVRNQKLNFSVYYVFKTLKFWRERSSTSLQSGAFFVPSQIPADDIETKGSSSSQMNKLICPSLLWSIYFIRISPNRPVKL